MLMNQIFNNVNCESLKELSGSDLKYLMTMESDKIDFSKISTFLVNPDIKNFIIEYLWEVGAPDNYINLIEKASISSRWILHAYSLLDYEGIHYIVLPSGAVVSWI